MNQRRRETTIGYTTSFVTNCQTKPLQTEENPCAWVELYLFRLTFPSATFFSGSHRRRVGQGVLQVQSKGKFNYLMETSGKV